MAIVKKEFKQKKKNYGGISAGYNNIILYYIYI